MTAEAGSFGFGCCTTPPLPVPVVFVLLSLLLLPQPLAATATTAQQSAAFLIPLPTEASQVRCRRYILRASGQASRPPSDRKDFLIAAQRDEPEHHAVERGRRHEHSAQRRQVAAAPGGDTCGGIGDVAPQSRLDPQVLCLAGRRQSPGRQRYVARSEQAPEVRRLRVGAGVEA